MTKLTAFFIFLTFIFISICSYLTRYLNPEGILSGIVLLNPDQVKEVSSPVISFETAKGLINRYIIESGLVRTTGPLKH